MGRKVFISSSRSKKAYKRSAYILGSLGLGIAIFTLIPLDVTEQKGVSIDPPIAANSLLTVKPQKGVAYSPPSQGEALQPCCMTPPARPAIDACQNFFVQGSVFYWQPEQGGLNYSLFWENTGNPAGSNTSGKGKFQHPKFKWDWGFKVAAGYNTSHDGWDLFLQWTRFHPEKTHASDLCTSGGFQCGGGGLPAIDPEAVVYPLLLPVNAGTIGSTNGTPPGFYGPGTSAAMSWKLRLDLLDLELGREFFVSKWLTLRPYAGVRSAWLHQRASVQYSDLSVTNDPTVDTVDVSASLKNNFWGMGPRIGFDAQWGIACGFSLYSELAADLLLGHFNIFEVQQPVIDTDNNPVIGSSESFGDKFRAMRGAFDLEIGLRYERLFSCDRFGFMVEIGWEQHLFLNQNQLTRLATVAARNPNPQNSFAYTPVTNQGDLSTQGVTLTVEFDF